VAQVITRFAGSMTFVYLHLCHLRFVDHGKSELHPILSRIRPVPRHLGHGGVR
jgi:hypothetical protein